MRKSFFSLLLSLPLLACLAACELVSTTPSDPNDKPSEKDSTEVEQPPVEPVDPSIDMSKTGQEYLYDTSGIP